MPAYPVDVMMGSTMKVIIETRRLSKAERVVLIGNAIKKVDNGEIVVVVDDDNAEEDISHAEKNKGGY